MSQIPWLEGKQDFPPINQALADPDGLLAAGGDLSSERIISAYRSGVFPWFEEDQPILWWSPNPRAVLIPADIHISKSLKKTLRRHSYTLKFDTHFLQVMEACAGVRNYTDGTWITEEMIEAYSHLHDMGVAHSVEVWDGSNLVGGLYGLALGKVFFGESMFSRANDTSKIALVFLAEHLQKWGFELIDCQVENDHLNSLGAQCIERVDFKKHLENLLPSEGFESMWPTG
jgi:leucyl/phenylalanyl-tRNA--protein transferase